MAGRVLSFCLLPAAVLGFTHPGLLVTDADIARAKSKIKAEQEPWLGSWEKLTSLEFSNTSYTSNAVSTISRSTNGELLWHDAAAAFNLALRWKISGEEEYAEASANLLIDWSEKLTSLSGGGDDDYLTAGLQGYELANAAELLRDYSPFAKGGLGQVQEMMTDIFLPMNLAFLNHELPSEHNVLHFFANWELCNLASAQAIGVLTENKTTWDFATSYFKNGVGNGNINHAISNIVKEPGTGKPLGQGQESGRDQGHSALDFQLLAAIGQQAWNQGEDLFAYNNSRILLGAEYFARYNLGNGVPFEPYTNGIVSYTNISSASRGAIRPNWELLHAHYVQIKGLDAPWTTAYLNNTLGYFGGFEGGAGSMGEGSGHYDGLGWGSLLYHLDESNLASVSSSTAFPTSTSSTSQFAVKSVATSINSTQYLVSVASITSTGSVLHPPDPLSSTVPSVANNVSTPTSNRSVDLAQSTLGAHSTSQGQPNYERKGKGCHV